MAETKKGEFVFEDISYHTCHAMLEEEGNILDFMDYKYRGDGLKVKDGATTLGELLKGIEVTLPEKHELLDLRVQTDRKNGGYMFVPKYSEADEVAGGKPSMRIFKPTKEVSLKPYRTYKVRQESVKNTGRPNARGCIILEVGVTVL